jgi:hypothetical protein
VENNICQLYLLKLHSLVLRKIYPTTIVLLEEEDYKVSELKALRAKSINQKN